jgi:gliding motility-associated-like protein
MRRLFKYFITFLSITPWPLKAQFVLNGSAVDLGDDCIRLTPALTTQTGSAWYPDKINLEQDFRVEASLFLGSSDAGADGIAFVLQPLSTAVGASGGGLGYLGVTPSVAVEFDTYQNSTYSDPSCDHVAIVSDGNPAHSGPTSLAAPVNILPGTCNAENNAYHEVSIRWTSATSTLEVFVNCSLRVAYTGDLVTTVFGGDPLVYFGFTAATGALSNEQIACYNRLDIALPAPVLSTCSGDTVSLSAPPGFSGYSWSPALELSDPFAENPQAWPASSTTYTVTYTDACGELYQDSVVIQVDAIPEIPRLPADTTLCEGSPLVLGQEALPGYTYSWSTGSTASSIPVSASGTYTLQIRNGLCLAETEATVTFTPFPELIFPQATVSWCAEDELFLTPQSNATAYLWSTGVTTPILAVTEPGVYVLEASLGNCAIRDSVQVLLQLECGCLPSLPNAFSPNSDGLNDEFRWVNYAVCPDLDQFVLRIFNRWGELVFESLDPVIGWDGFYRGLPAELGVYVYQARSVTPGEGPVWTSGTVTLVR